MVNIADIGKLTGCGETEQVRDMGKAILRKIGE
jgi:hypothetical protein